MNIKAYIKNKSNQRKIRKYKKGYAYASRLLLMQVSKCVTRLQGEVALSTDFGFYNEFDVGVERAIKDALDLDLVSEDMIR